MHEIESLIEYSVKTVATTSPVLSLARDICFSLYKLQDKFDCGYTVLRVQEELKRLGYLYLLSPELLPEMEQNKASMLMKEGGFIDEDTYFDCLSGVCYVTAGSELWKKLLRMDILPKKTKAEIRDLSLLELMETIIPLASKQFAKGDPVGVDTLGLWYGLFPVICLVTGFDEESETERIQNLLRLLAIPEAFRAAESYVREVDFDDWGDENELSFLAEWRAPYKEWKEKEENKTLFPEFCKRMVYEYMGKKEFAEADRYASYLGTEDDPARLLHRSMVSVACHQWLKTQEFGTMLPEGILPLAEAKAGFEYLVSLELSEQERTLCRLYVIQILELLGDYSVAVERLQQMYAEAVIIVAERPDNDAKRMQQAVLAVSYYQMLYDGISEDYIPKKKLLQSGLSGLMDIDTARRTCCELLQEMPQIAETLQQNIEVCDQLIDYLQD